MHWLPVPLLASMSPRSSLDVWLRHIDRYWVQQGRMSRQMSPCTVWTLCIYMPNFRLPTWQLFSILYQSEHLASRHWDLKINNNIHTWRRVQECCCHYLKNNGHQNNENPLRAVCIQFSLLCLRFFFSSQSSTATMKYFIETRAFDVTAWKEQGSCIVEN